MLSKPIALAAHMALAVALVLLLFALFKSCALYSADCTIVLLKKEVGSKDWLAKGAAPPPPPPRTDVALNIEALERRG